MLKNYLKRVIIFCFRTRASEEGKEREEDFLFFCLEISLFFVYNIYV